MFSLICLAFYVPMIILAGASGALCSVLLTGLLPTRRRRRIVLAAVGIITFLAFARIQPELIKEQGSLAGILQGYLPHISFAKNPFLPSTWTTRGIILLSQSSLHPEAAFREGSFYFLLLLSSALFVLALPTDWVAGFFYRRIYLSSCDHTESRSLKRAKSRQFLERQIDAMPWPSRPVMAFLEKDIKVFVREPAEWSQMIIFFGLLLFYFANLKNLEFHILKAFWKEIVFLLNTLGTYIVLSSFSMRFIFPMISLEGSRFWILSLSPIRFRDLLLEKFAFGTVTSLLLTAPLIFVSGWMLEMPASKLAFSTGLAVFVCMALTGLSVGFGATFPNFKSTNPSEIISGLGGSLLLVCHLIYLSFIGFVLAFSGGKGVELFFLLALISLFTALIPVHRGARSLEKREF